MPNQQIEHGAPTRLSTITSLLASQKLRVAGRQDFSIRCVSQYFAEGLASRLLHDDTESSTIMIHDGEDALFVDMSLCLNPWKRSLWLRESKSVIMVLGYLELSSVSRPCYLLETFDILRGWLLCTECSPLPLLHAHAPLVDVNPRLVLRAIIVEEARDLDLALWNRAVQAQEELVNMRKSADRATETPTAT